MIQFKSLIKTLELILRKKTNRLSHNKYISVVSLKAPWIYISYISNVYYSNIETNLNTHQNKREALSHAEIFNKLGYNVYIQAADSNDPLPNLNVTIVFGIEPNFIVACNKYSQAKKIYYATGAYCIHQNNQIIQWTDAFNKKYSKKIPYRRLVSEHKSCQIADSILQIGSKYTKETYPDELRKKISIIHQSTQNTNLVEIGYAEENEFLCLVSSGTILKGVHLVVKAFSMQKKLKLNLVGCVEEDVLDILENTLDMSNVQYWGYLDVLGNTFAKIIKRCNYSILLSGSEGCPGSILTSMKLGLIPIVSPWAACDNIEKYGFIIRDLSYKNIKDNIQRVSLLPKNEIIYRKTMCQHFIAENYSLKHYKQELFDYFFKLVEQ